MQFDHLINLIKQSVYVYISITNEEKKFFRKSFCAQPVTRVKNYISESRR